MRQLIDWQNHDQWYSGEPLSLSATPIHRIETQHGKILNCLRALSTAPGTEAWTGQNTPGNHREMLCNKATDFPAQSKHCKSIKFEIAVP